MSGALNPILHPEAWDVVYVGGIPSPGLATVTGAKLPNVFDVKRGKGAQGATITYTGNEPSKFSIKLLFWLEAHFVAWDDWRTLLKYDGTKKAVNGVDIAHPALADLGIVSCVTESIGQVEIEDKSAKTWAVTIDFLEFRKPGPNATSTPTTSTTNASTGAVPTGTQPPTAADAQQAEIDHLLSDAAGAPTLDQVPTR